MSGLQSRHKRDLLIQPAASPGQEARTIVAVTPEEAGWEYISFRVQRLPAGQEITDASGDEEIGLVILEGTATVRSDAGSWPGIGERTSVFDGLPYCLYLPPGTGFTVRAETDLEFARAGAPADGTFPPRLFTPEDITVELRGAGSAQRRVHPMMMDHGQAEHLLLVEVITPEGHWSSYPPHKHDQHDPPRETMLEETYFYRVDPPQGFAFQRVYTDDRSLDTCLVPGDRSLVLVPKGYHPVAAAPGYNVYYLNVMAGPTREWKVQDDPHHAWVKDMWS